MRKQEVLAAPLWILKESYLTKKGQRLMYLVNKKDKKAIAVINEKYRKNRYRLNPDALYPGTIKLRIVKMIRHLGF